MFPTSARRRSAPRAFTLFEVALSLALLAFGVVSVLTLLPMGIKAQQLARLQLYAAAKAEEMVECFSAAQNANPAIDTEAPNPWDVPVSYRSQAWDMEARLSSHRFGIMPLPLDIARRIDCDGDEIQQILSEGGYLYYSMPNATAHLNDSGQLLPPPTETQRLVFTVSGYAQNNAVHIFPWKNWPYVAPYPSPPVHGLHYHDTNLSLPSGAQMFTWPDTYRERYCWESTTVAGASQPGADDQIKDVFTAFKAYAYEGTPDQAKAIAYLQAALLYCQRKGLRKEFYDPSPTRNPVNPSLVAAPKPLVDLDPAIEAWKQVQGMRFLAHAAATMTRWKTLSDLGGQLPTTLPAGTEPPGFAIAADTNGSPAIVLTHDKIVYYHESCLNLAMLFCASRPYDWAVPRPLQRSIMMDFPLIEYDLFSPPQNSDTYGAIQGTSGLQSSQWKPIPARPIDNIGLSYQFPKRPIPDAGDPQFWGDQAHFTLTKRFEAAQRCRQIVFWMVDWKSYEDFETAPSAPVDASKYPFQAPIDGKTFAQRMDDCGFEDALIHAYRNPEKGQLFTRDVRTHRTGTDESQNIMRFVNSNPMDKGHALDRRRCFSGMYGADRNFNRRLDRGPIKTSVRLRAEMVARFNIYDPRVPAVLR